jgi:2-haloalkanoic acid dehalogenase type II
VTRVDPVTSKEGRSAVPADVSAALAGVTAVSLDVYGTLLDLDAVSEVTITSVCDLVGAPPDLRIWRQVSSDIFDQMQRMEFGEASEPPSSEFRPVRRMFEEAYRRVLPRFGLAKLIDPAQAAFIVTEAHAKLPPYPDVLPAVRRLAERFALCAASDADEAFLHRALEHAGLAPYLGARVSSETVGAYKIDPGGRFFGAVLAALGREAEAVVHVGDGQSDIIGAKRSGLVAVWLNRGGRAWGRTDVAPDAVVGDLEELADLLLSPATP